MCIENFVKTHLKKGALILSAFCFAALFWQYTQLKETSIHYLDQSGKDHILILPTKDRQRLFYMMSWLFAKDPFAYTLLGSKPVSWESHEQLPSWKLFLFDNPWEAHCRAMCLGWETWLKYSHLFPTAPMWLESSKKYPNSISIFIINEDQFCSVVNKHKQDFQTILHRESVDGSELFKKIKDHPLMDELLQGHQALLGIVLGFGRENSWAFLQSAEIRKPMECVWADNDWQIEAWDKQTQARTLEERISIDTCPRFAGYPLSEESIALKKEYLETRERVIAYYKGKDFLEATLSLLAGYRPPETPTVTTP